MFEVLRGLEQVAPFLEQLGAGGGEHHARAVALEHLHAQVILELADRVRDGRWYAVQFLAGGGKRTTAVDGIDDLQGFQA